MCKGENVSFSHQLFYTLSDNYLHFSLTLSQTINIRLFQNERLCRRQFQIWWKSQKVLKKGRKHCGKRRNWSLRAISPFPTVFSSLVLQTRKNQGLFGKGLMQSLWQKIMVTILQTLMEISWLMQAFSDLQNTSRSLNACIYHEISISVWKNRKKKLIWWWKFTLSYNIFCNYSEFGPVLNFFHVAKREIDSQILIEFYDSLYMFQIWVLKIISVILKQHPAFLFMYFNSFPTQSWLLTILGKKPFENIVGKGENAGNQHFLLFLQCFLPFPLWISNFHFK